jgi:non-ribosomal peptide synthetase component E (peptide arylation enzyme)
VPQHFASIVSRYGDRTAVISRAQSQRVTYHELDHKSNALARGLQNLGVRKGERVAVSLGNNIEFAVVCVMLPRQIVWILMSTRRLTLCLNWVLYL